MIRLLAIVGISICACAAIGQTQSADDEIRLRATVQAVVPLSAFSGTVTPVGVDPRFALTVRIDSVAPTVTNFPEGAVVTLAIHSPSQLFTGEPTKGKTYDFVLHRVIQDGKVRFFGLKIRAA